MYMSQQVKLLFVKKIQNPVASSITQAEASTKAQQVLEKLVAGNKLGGSWGSVKAKEISEKKSHHGDPVWVALYVNADEKDAGKQNLYIVLDEVGNVVSAEHTEKL